MNRLAPPRSTAVLCPSRWRTELMVLVAVTALLGIVTTSGCATNPSDPGSSNTSDDDGGRPRGRPYAHPQRGDLNGVRPGASIDLRRIALVGSDCTRSLPSFPAATKRRDPRWRWFTSRYGDTCWELDALDPRDLRDRVEDAILAEIDDEAWERCKLVERAEHASLRDVMARFRGI